MGGLVLPILRFDANFLLQVFITGIPANANRIFPFKDFGGSVLDAL